MLFAAMVPDGTSKLGFFLGNTVPQAPDLIIRQVFHEKRVKLSAGQSQVTSISNYLTGWPEAQLTKAVLISQTEQSVDVREAVLQRSIQREYLAVYFFAPCPLVIRRIDFEVAP